MRKSKPVILAAGIIWVADITKPTNTDNHYELNLALRKTILSTLNISLAGDFAPNFLRNFLAHKNREKIHPKK